MNRAARFIVDSAFTFLLGVFMTGISVVLWHYAVAFISAAPLIIHTFDVKNDMLRFGDKFTYTGAYTKSADCPGQWTVRAENLTTGVVYQIATGRIGTHPVGDYDAEWAFQLDKPLPAGNYDFMEIIDGICEGGISFVARSPKDRVTIID